MKAPLRVMAVLLGWLSLRDWLLILAASALLLGWIYAQQEVQPISRYFELPTPSHHTDQ